MNWLILVTMTLTDPFVVPILEFETKNECVNYVMDPSNSNRLAVEIIGKAGFNDEIIGIACKPANTITLEKLNEA